MNIEILKDYFIMPTNEQNPERSVATGDLPAGRQVPYILSLG